MKAAKLFYEISSRVVYIISFAILAVLTITNLRFSTYVTDVKEWVDVRTTNLFLTGISVIGLLVLFYIILRFSEKIDERKLFIICAVLYLIAGIYMITNISSLLRYDALAVHNASIAMHHGDFSTMDMGHYTYRYPHQIGFLIYEYLIGFVSKDPKIIFSMNLIEILFINFFLYKITKEIFKDQHKVNLMTIVLSFLFFPQFFFVTFAYGLIPGLFLLTIGIYYLLRAERTKEKKFMILSGIFLMLAVLMKKNFIIALTACLCYLFLKYFKEKDKKMILSAIFLVAVFVAGKAVMTVGFEAYTGKKVNQGVPAILWVAMGTDPDNHRRAGGWYDRKYVSVYKESHYDREKAERTGQQMVSGYFDQYKKDPQKAYDFFSKKIITTWSDPLYEAVFSGPKEKAGQYVKTKPLYHLFNDQKRNTGLYVGMKACIILIFATTWIFLIKYYKKYETISLGLIFLIGGFLFHLFWETKGQYVYPYVFMQIPASAYVITRLFEKTTA